jgi:ABC-type microcin C transport system permease subunit YejB
MKTRRIVVLLALPLLIGTLFVIPSLQIVLAQIAPLDQMISQMRSTHSQMTSEIDNVKQLLESNNTKEALTLLDAMDIKISHMNDMFNDLVWEASNKGH